MMENFLNEQTLRKARDRARRRALILWGLALCGLALLIVLCARTRTGNARQMLTLSLSLLIPLGWAALLYRIFREEPARSEARHLQGLAEKAPEIREGRFSLREDSFRIPKSVRVQKVQLETETETLSLNLNERLRDRMPPDGSLVRVSVVSKFITGMEVLSPEQGAPSRPGPSRGKAILRGLGRFFPAAVLWALIAVIGIGFIFTRITDTDPKNKIVIYADCEITGAAALAEQLEQGLEGAVKMVKIHPFSYAMFNSDQLKNADLFLVPDSHRAEYEAWFGAPKEGLLFCDPGNGQSAAESWFQFTKEGAEPEIWRLYLGAASPHREDGLALKAAELLLALTDAAP